MRSTCDKVNGQILFRTVTYPASGSQGRNTGGTKADRHTWYERPGVAIPRSASDEKTAPVAAPPLGPFSNMTS